MRAAFTNLPHGFRDFGLTGLAVWSCGVFPFLPLPGATILDTIGAPCFASWVDQCETGSGTSNRLSLKIHPTENPCSFSKASLHPLVFQRPFCLVFPSSASAEALALSIQKASLYAGHRLKFGLQLETELSSRNINRLIYRYISKRN